MATARALRGHRLTCRGDQVHAGEVLAAVQGAGLGIVDVLTKEPDLEDVFLDLTSAAAAT